MNVWETLTYDVFHVERLLNPSQSDHRTESITLRFFGLTVHVPLRVKQRKSIINHTAFHFTRVYSTPRWAIHTGPIHTAEFKLLAFNVVLVCCVGIPHPLFVRLVSSDHPLSILYIFSLHYAVHESENNFYFPRVFTINLQRHRGI